MASKFAKYKANGTRGVQCWRLTANLKQSLRTIAEVKEALQVIWGNLSQGPIDKNQIKRLKACVLELGAGNGHFEHL